MSKKDFWYPDDVISDIINYLQTKFPESIIVRELNRVDILILKKESCLPVEIQKPYFNKDNPAISGFENSIRKQIEKNIELYGMCLFFFDAKLLEYLKNTYDRHIDIDMKWFYRYYIEKKLRVFTIDGDKFIRELKEEDLKLFIKFSVTKMDMNKTEIAYKLLNNHVFTTNEISNYYNLYRKNNTNYDNFYSWCTRKDASIREREYAKLSYALGFLDGIDLVLNCSLPNPITRKEFKYITLCYDLGILERSSYRNDVNNKISFKDKENISTFFHGYLKNKDIWEYIRDHAISNRTFYSIIKGEYPNFIIDHKKQKNIEDAWR